MRYGYEHSILGEEDYIQFHYQFNIFSFLAIVNLIYGIPSIIILIKMSYFYCIHQKKPNPNGPHPAIFRQFIVMQAMCVCHVTIRLLTFRIPLTGLMTSWCASEEPMSTLQLFVFMNTGVAYGKYISIILFCFLRVVLLFSLDHVTEVKDKFKFD